MSSLDRRCSPQEFAALLDAAKARAAAARNEAIDALRTEVVAAARRRARSARDGLRAAWRALAARARAASAAMHPG